MSRALNPWDAQTERIWTSDGAWHTLSGNTGGGQSRDCVLICLSQSVGRPTFAHIPSDMRKNETICFAPIGNHNAVFKETQTAATLQTGYHFGGGGDGALILNVLNPWDPQSKHIHTGDSVCETLCAGEKRWGGLSQNVLLARNKRESEAAHGRQLQP